MDGSAQCGVGFPMLVGVSGSSMLFWQAHEYCPYMYHPFSLNHYDRNVHGANAVLSRETPFQVVDASMIRFRQSGDRGVIAQVFNWARHYACG